MIIIVSPPTFIVKRVDWNLMCTNSFVPFDDSAGLLCKRPKTVLKYIASVQVGINLKQIKF